jgi:hypothetical protein
MVEGHALSWPHRTIGRDGARPSIYSIFESHIIRIFPDMPLTGRSGLSREYFAHECAPTHEQPL